MLMPAGVLGLQRTNLSAHGAGDIIFVKTRAETAACDNFE